MRAPKQAQAVNRDQHNKDLKALEKIIMTVNSTLDLEVILERIVEITNESLEADDTYIYLMDEEYDELTLSAATQSEAYDYRNTLKIKNGQGVAGHVSKTKKPYLINNNIHSDKHFLYSSFLGEDNYNSMLSVPILYKNDGVIGVLSIYSAQKDFFTKECITKAASITNIVAGLIVNAKLYEEVNKKAYVLERLSSLSVDSVKDFSSYTLDKTLQSLVNITLDVLDVESVYIIIPSMPLLNSNLFFNIKLMDAKNKHYNIQGFQKHVELLKKIKQQNSNLSNTISELTKLTTEVFKYIISENIVIEDDKIGYIRCNSLSRRFTSEEKAILRLITNHIALVIKNSILEKKIRNRYELNHFFEDLLNRNIEESQIILKMKKYKIDPESKYIIFTGKYTTAEKKEAIVIKELEKKFKRLYAENFILTFNDENLNGIVPVSERYSLNKVKTIFNKVIRKAENELLTIGISQIVNRPLEFINAMSEANEALNVGSKIYGNRKIYDIADLSYNVYINRLSKENYIRDKTKEKIIELVDYDHTNKTALFDTLKSFLNNAGNIRIVSEELFIHRNTVYQRLNKIEEILNIDIKDTKYWFYLQLIIKIIDFDNKK